MDYKKNRKPIYWTHPSVVFLRDKGDPVDAITARAKSLVYEAMQRGWSGPPFDPFELADILNIKTLASGSVLDAKIVASDKSKLLIEYNPNRPKGRLRFSIAHELAHALFPDCNEYVRERKERSAMKSDDWQLEMLCNVAAAEFLMPMGSFTDLLRNSPLSIDTLADLRKQFDVSFEALLHRVVKVSGFKCFAFFCSKKDILNSHEQYKIDYVLKSDGKVKTPSLGSELPHDSCVEDCTAIGFTSKGEEIWPEIGQIHIECVGIPPYPNYHYPRVAGLGSSHEKSLLYENKISYVKGDATQPRGKGNRIIAFIINDKGLAWGAGFARCLQKRWPFVQHEFKQWALSNRRDFSLGNVHASAVDEKLVAFKMICQHGYGSSPWPRIRYKALEECLKKLSETAMIQKASVHMPRIGTGEAGGSWEIISELIEDYLCRVGIKVTVYDLPVSKRLTSSEGVSLFDEITYS